MLSIVFYNVLMLAIVVGEFVLVQQRRTLLAGVISVATTMAAGLALALVLGQGRFGSVMLFAYGVFLHPTLLLIGCTWLSWRTARRNAYLFAAGAIVLPCIAIDAFLIEPTWLEVTHYEIRSAKVKTPLRIVVIADLQTDRIGAYERRALSRALEERPDMIVMAGDYLQADSRQQLLALRSELRQLLIDLDFRAPLGVYAVRGNVDPGDWKETFTGLPITLMGRTRSLQTDRPDLLVTSLSMGDSFAAHTVVEDSPQYQVCIGHCPNFALGEVRADLLIAGHTHGGQVRLPIVGPLITLSNVPRQWATGMTQLSPGRHLVVSRGIGMERGAAPRLRFLCSPELAVIDVLPE